MNEWVREQTSKRVSEWRLSDWMNERINEWVSESQSEQINKLLISSLSNKTCKSKITLVIQMEVKKCCKLRQVFRENCVISWGDYIKKEIGNGQAKRRPCLKVKNNWYLLTGKKKTLVGLSAACDKDYTSMVGCATTVCSWRLISILPCVPSCITLSIHQQNSSTQLNRFCD